MKAYPKEVQDFIAENVAGMTSKDLALLVNSQFETTFNAGKMQAYKKNHKLKSGTRCGVPAGSPSKLYPQEIKDFIKANCTGTGRPAMAELLNETFGTNYTASQMKSYYHNHNIKSRVDTKFKKGNIPGNKGVKGIHLSPETEFQKGDMPHNHRPVGTETLRADGYVYVKIAEPKKWRQKHILIWEKEHGPLPAGCRVLFADSNRQNFNLDNLILVSRAQLVRLNQNKLITNDPDATRTGIIIADLHIQIAAAKRREKKAKKEVSP